jgi:hypothetical protein
MNRLRIAFFAILLLPLLLVIVLLKTGVTIAASPTTCGQWTRTPSPNVGTYSNYFNGVAAISPTDIWAVGNHSTGFDNVTKTMTEHWNGQQWSVIPSPNATKGYNFLNGVSADSTNDVWAVGASESNGPAHPLIEHWNGTQWSIIPSPRVITTMTGLVNVVAISSTDAWAVGGYYIAGTNTVQTLIEHWNGSKWSVASHPQPSGATSSGFSGITAISAHNIWVVGGYGNNAGNSLTLFEQWNGAKWSIVPSPSPNNYVNSLFKIAAVSARDIWAVGYQVLTTQSYPHALIEHWNGSKWSVVPGAMTPNNIETLYGVAAIAPNDVWAVGQYNKKYNKTPMLIEHWDGTRWSVVSGPNAGSISILASAARIPGTSSVWAAGNATNNSGIYKTLTVSYC